MTVGVAPAVAWQDVQQAGQVAGAADGDWTVPGVFGPERWQRAGGRFGAVTCGPERIVLPADALTLERLRAREPRCAHPGPFPLAFGHCPDCGIAMAPPPAVPRAGSWSPPCGAADGLPTLDETRQPLSDGEEIPVPASASLAFAVAGTPPMLLACDRASGWISGWSEAERRWIERVQIPAGAGLPGWSFAASADARGLALPTDRGPAWTALDGPLRVPVTLLEGVTPLGGAAALRDRVAVPVQAEHGPALALLDRSAALPGWTMLPVAGAPAGSIGMLAAPVVAADAASWCGAGGQLTLQATADGPVARWQGWRDGVQPLRGVRPVMERNGTLHQLARLDAATLVLEGLATPGQVAERRAARGYTPGTGRAVFRENAQLRLPWDERETASYVLPDDSFLLPLLALDESRFIVAVGSGRDGFGRFLGDPGASDRGDALHACTLFYSRGPRMLEPLGCVLQARHAWDLSMVVHGDWLLAHGAVENRCHRWRLRDAG